MTADAMSVERTVKIMKLSFIFAAALLIFICYRRPSEAHRPPGPAMEWIIAAIALGDVALGFLAPRMLTKIAVQPAAAAAGSTAERQWMSRCILSLSFFFSCNLFAMVLHFVGARVYFVDALFAVGILALLLWSPGAAPGREDSAIRQM